MPSTHEQRAYAETSARPPEHGLTIQDASAYVLRGGVILSVAIMLFGTVLTFARHHASIERMDRTPIEVSPKVIWHGLLEGRGQSFVELGVYVLVFTPIMRVFTSMVLFLFEERDWLYAAVTFVVLVLTLMGLLRFG